MKGIIYKIVCNETNMVYYGSATKSMNKRISDHKSGYKRWKAGSCWYTSSYSIIERGNYSYSLIETVECEDRKQLETRERYYIENNECINIHHGRTKQDYRERLHMMRVEKDIKQQAINQSIIEEIRGNRKQLIDAKLETIREHIKKMKSLLTK